MQEKKPFIENQNHGVAGQYSTSGVNNYRERTLLRSSRFRSFMALVLIGLALVSLSQVGAAKSAGKTENLLPSTYSWDTSFSAQALAVNAPQSVDAISQKATLVLEGDNRIISAVIDEAGGFAYFGTDTSPGTVIKVRLSDFTRVDTLTLKEGEDKLTSAVIDPGNGFAYFGTNTSPGIVVKVRLSDFKRVGALSLPDLISGEVALNKLTSAVIDPGNGFAYFGTDTIPASIAKIRLSDFSREGQLPLPESNLSTAVIDLTKGYAYFGTRTSPGKVVRIKLSDFSRTAAITLSDGSGADQIEKNLAASVIDPVKEYAYFATDSSSGTVVRVDIREDSFQRTAALTTNPNPNGRIKSAVIDPANGKAYFGTQPDSGSAVVIKVNLLTFSTESQVTANSGPLWAGVIDNSNSFAYFGTYEIPAHVFKVNVSTNDFSEAGDLTLNSAAQNLWAAVIDPAAGYAYFGGYQQPGTVTKVRLADFSRVATLKFNNTEDGILSAVIDTTNGFAYFGTSTNPAKVIRVRLSDFTQAGSITLEQGEERLTSAVIDTANGFAYFGTDTSPGKVVKVNVSPSNFSRVAAITLEAGQNNEDGEDKLTSAVIDPANNFAYFGTNTNPGKVVKVQVSPNSFARIAVAPLLASEDELTSAVIDTSKGLAYFGTNTNPGRVVEVDVNPNNAFTRRGFTQLTINRLSSAVIDPNAGKAYFGSQEQPGKVAEVGLSPLVQQSAISLKNGEDYLTAAVIDTAKGCAYFGTGYNEAGDFDNNYPSSGQARFVIKIQAGACKDGTTTTLTSAPNPSNTNQTVMFTAEVSAGTGTPTGQVVFSENGSQLASSQLNNGVATFNTSSLSAGPHTIVAMYNGDATYDGSTASHTHTVQDNRTTTTTTLGSTPNPSKVGEQVSFTANVSSSTGTPTGSVTFTEGTTTLGTSSLNNGVAIFITNSLSEGDHAIVAKYSGDSNYAPSNSAAYNQTVNTGSGNIIYLPVVLRP